MCSSVRPVLREENGNSWEPPREGYAGILVGPAAVGFVSHATDLPGGFWFLATLVLALTLRARAATRD